MSRLIRVFEADADAETGQLISEIRDTGEVADKAVWDAHADTEGKVFLTYDHWIEDETGWQTGETETRAVVLNMIPAEEQEQD